MLCGLSFSLVNKPLDLQTLANFSRLLFAGGIGQWYQTARQEQNFSSKNRVFGCTASSRSGRANQ
jgi:hypothetical protein